ncbi:hypothetical protein BH09PAT2_BH09PAT2_10870 [soil metagenome]
MDTHDQKIQKIISTILDVYSYILDNGTDITNEEEIKKVLKTLNLELPDDVGIDVLIRGLVGFHEITKAHASKTKKEEAKRPN